MTANAPMPEPRQKLSFDFDDTPTVDSAEVIKQKIEEISEETGFIARATPKRASTTPKPISQIKPVEASPVRTRRRRAKTGRTHPFNTKLRIETYDTICALADLATEKENRPVSFAEIIERGTDLLEKQMKNSVTL